MVNLLILYTSNYSHITHAQTCIHAHTVPPTFLTHPQAVLDALEWSSVTLTCSASGTPPPLISWEREGEAQLPVGAVLNSTISGNIVKKNYLKSIVLIQLFNIMIPAG